jgi:hypothetical protein
MIRFFKILFLISLTAVIGYALIMIFFVYLFTEGCGNRKPVGYEFSCTKSELVDGFERLFKKEPSLEYVPGFDSSQCNPNSYYCTEIYLKGEKDYAVYLGLANADSNVDTITTPSYLYIDGAYDFEGKIFKKAGSLSDDEIEYIDERLKTEVLVNLKNDSCTCTLLEREE